jgi:hypothetical protein
MDRRDVLYIVRNVQERTNQVRGTLDFFAHNDGDKEARDITVSLFMPYELDVYEADGHTPLTGDYTITDFAVNPEGKHIFDASHQFHRMRAKLHGRSILAKHIWWAPRRSSPREAVGPSSGGLIRPTGSSLKTDV